jgi:1,4-dihydroxy-2-naphthoyl-CoA hydrolase
LHYCLLNVLLSYIFNIEEVFMGGDKAIWRRELDIDELQRRGAGTLAETMGINFIEIGVDFMRASMQVDAKLRQPLGLLNGGASAALAETVASTAGNYCVGEGYCCVGAHVSASHLLPVREGLVIATTKPLHLGGRTQLWEVKITREDGRIFCDARMSLQVIRAGVCK